jgi:hypothetical protein
MMRANECSAEGRLVKQAARQIEPAASNFSARRCESDVSARNAGNGWL